jgi:hypothetical protein
MTAEYQTRSSGNGVLATARTDGRTQSFRSGQSERSIGELFSALSSETRSLVRDEIRLAQAELKANTAGIGANAGKIGLGGTLLHVSLLTFTAAVVMLLGTFVPLWVAGLIVSVLYAIIGFSMLNGGLRGLKKVSLMPKETIRTLQEDAQWAKQQI